MKIVIGVDWSDEAFAAVRTVSDLFAPESLTLAHAIDLRPFETPLIAPAISRQAYEAFKDAMQTAGDEVLDASSKQIPPGWSRIERVAEVGAPTSVILDVARKREADLIVVGSRGRNRLAETVLGSVSHRVLAQAPCAVLIARAPFAPIERIVLGVEGYDDGGRLVEWLTKANFLRRPPVTVVSATPYPQYFDPVSVTAFGPWEQASCAAAQQLVNDISGQLKSAGFAAAGAALRGDPARGLVDEDGTNALIVVASHARKGFERALLGSVSHAVTHAAKCPVLVVPLS